MDALSVLALAKACSTVPSAVLAALAFAQTKAEPFTIGVSGEVSTYATFDKAVQVATAGAANKEFVQVGIALIPLSELRKRNISLTDGLSTCRNLKVAGDLVTAEWQQLGGKNEDWLRAATAFAVGHPDAGEVNNFEALYKKHHDDLKALEPQTNAVMHAQPQSQDKPRPQKRPAASASDERSVDVFQRSTVRDRPLRFSLE